MQSACPKKVPIAEKIIQLSERSLVKYLKALNLEITLDYKTSILACLMHELLSIKDQRVACLKPFNLTCFTGSFRILHPLAY